MASGSLQSVVAEFSSDGEHFAYLDGSGSLQILETATRTRRQQYTPSAHLSESFSCLSWAPTRATSDCVTSSKKRRRSVESAANLELIALGTAKGSVLLYSRTTNDLHSQLTGSHSDQVNDICWHPDQDKLFSCSSDKHIVEWSISKSSSKHKWKADDTAIHAISLCHTKCHLLSAGNKIKLWDLDTHQILQTFTGHASHVFRLLHVPCQMKHKTPETPNVPIVGSYVLSASVEDHHINLWQIGSSEQKTVKKPVASFALPDNPIQISVTSQRHNKLHLLSVTSGGKLALFEHSLNGHAGVLKPELVVAYKTEDNKKLPVRAASFGLDNVDSIILAYSGDGLMLPDIETQHVKELKSHKPNKKGEVYLQREKPAVMIVSLEASLSRLKTPEVSGNVTVIRPSDAGVNVPVASHVQQKPNTWEVTVEERLNALGVIDLPSMNSAAGGSKRTPKTDSVATLLVQGLQSEDKNMLNNVLQKREVDIIQPTVQRLPLTAIVPLVKELKKRMGGHAQSALVARKWLKCVLMTHSSYLMTLPDRASILGELQQILETRLDVFRKVCQLQGRLDLILSQITSKGQSQEQWNTQPPQLVYKDVASDGEDSDGRIHEEEMMSEDEEQWDEDNDNEDRDASSSDSDDMDVSYNGTAKNTIMPETNRKRRSSKVD